MGAKYRIRRTVSKALLSVTVLALCGACGTAPDQGVGQDEPSVSASASPSTVESEDTAKAGTPISPNSAPARPKDLEMRDPQAAESAAKYFLELYSHAIASREISEFRRLSSTDCYFCKDFTKHISKLKENNEYYEGGAISVSKIVRDEADGEEGTVKVYFYMKQQEASIVDANGAVVDSYPAASMGARVDLVFTEGAWLVTRVEVEEEAK